MARLRRVQTYKPVAASGAYPAGMSPTAFPRSAMLACWLVAVLRGRVDLVRYAEAVRGADPAHLVVGLGLEPLDLADAATYLAREGVGAIGLALPVPGQPEGLAGPTAFNAAAYSAGEAVVLGGVGAAPARGLLPWIDARSIVWEVLPAVLPPFLDPGEVGGELRRVLVAATHRLVELDVAAWQPEIPDMLANLRHREPLPLPPGLDPQRLETIERAVLCLDIVALAVEEEGAAVSAYEVARRREVLGNLGQVARRALVGCCSDNLGPS